MACYRLAAVFNHFYDLSRWSARSQLAASARVVFFYHARIASQRLGRIPNILYSGADAPFETNSLLSLRPHRAFRLVSLVYLGSLGNVKSCDLSNAFAFKRKILSTL